MTIASDLLDELHAAGAELVLISGELRLIGNRSGISPDLRSRLRAARPELLDHLRPHPCADCGRFWFREAGTVCYWCAQKAKKAQEAR